MSASQTVGVVVGFALLVAAFVIHEWKGREYAGLSVALALFGLMVLAVSAIVQVEAGETVPAGTLLAQEEG